jgi:predicted nucleic acid-binding protein
LKIFIDTGGFAALYYPKDSNHAIAVDLWRTCKEQRLRIYTSNYVLAETFTLLRHRSGHGDACKFGDAMYSLNSQLTQVVRVSDIYDQHAWELFKKYADHDFSFVDCSSFAIMRNLGISKVFAFDHHFNVMGFERLPS